MDDAKCFHTLFLAICLLNLSSIDAEAKGFCVMFLCPVAIHFLRRIPVKP